VRYVLERTSEPEIEPVSAAEFIRNVGEFSSAATERADDISLAITAAREWVEKRTGRALIDQGWRLTLTDDQAAYDRVAGSADVVTGYITSAMTCIPLFRSPVIEITSFVSVDSAGDETAIDSATYELREADSKWPKLVALNSASWGTGTYRIGLRAGYANRDVSPGEGASVVPARFRKAILLYAEALYDRERMDELMQTADSLIAPENCNTGLA
jgi:uncharacterized phiE125 gp8 family phage protein